MTVRVMGIDISLTATGVAFPSGHCRTIRPEGGPDDPGRRLWSVRQQWQMPLAGKIDVAVIEAYALGGHQGLTMARIAEVGGIIRSWLFACGVPWVEIPPSSLKKWATGNGRTAQKHDMVRAARNAGGVVMNDDEADAWWLRDVGEKFYNLPVEQYSGLEKHQQELLDRVNWPRI